MFLPISVLFFVESQGLSPAAVGLSLTVTTLLALGAAPLGATLIQRWGAGWAAAADYGATALAYAAYPFVTNAGTYFVALLATRLASQWARPAHLVLARHVAGADAVVRLLATSRALRNVGMAVGAGLAAVALSLGDPTTMGRLLIGFDVASYAVAGILTVRYLPLTAGRHQSSPQVKPPPSWREVGASTRYIRVTGVALLVSPQTPLLVVALPLSLEPITRLSGTLTGAALATNTALVAALQVRASKGSETVRGAVVALRRGAVLLAASCLVMTLVRPGTTTVMICVIVAAFVLTNTAAELWISAGSWGAALGLAPDSSPRHLTLFTSVESIGAAVSSGLVAVLIAGHRSAGWIFFAALAVGAAALTLSLRSSNPETSNQMGALP